eukprot:2470963-Rhodomonas_salina.2
MEGLRRARGAWGGSLSASRHVASHVALNQGHVAHRDAGQPEPEDDAEAGTVAHWHGPPPGLPRPQAVSATGSPGRSARAHSSASGNSGLILSLSAEVQDQSLHAGQPVEGSGASSSSGSPRRLFSAEKVWHALPVTRAGPGRALAFKLNLNLNVGDPQARARTASARAS